MVRTSARPPARSARPPGPGWSARPYASPVRSLASEVPSAPARPTPADSAADRRARRLAELGMLGITLCWAGNFVVIKAAIAEVPPITLSCLRFGLAGLALLAVLRWREGSVGLPRRDLLGVAALGALGFGLYQVLWATALQWTGAGDSALLIAATPIITALLAVAAGTDSLTPEKAGGALVAFAGVALIVWSGAVSAPAGTSSLLGALMTLCAAACWAVYVSFGAAVLRRHSPLRTTTWAVLAGTAAMVPAALWELGGWDVSAVQPGIALALAYSSLLAVGAANVINFRAIQLLGPTRVTAYQFLVPAFAVLIAAVFLAEPIRAGQLVGGSVIVGGILIARGTFSRGAGGLPGTFVRAIPPPSTLRSDREP
jgi:drug/metabolite transporter (DMT)-like permease